MNTGEGPPLPTLKQVSFDLRAFTLSDTGEGPPLPTLKPAVDDLHNGCIEIPERAPLSLH